MWVSTHLKSFFRLGRRFKNQKIQNPKNIKREKLEGKMIEKFIRAFFNRCCQNFIYKKKIEELEKEKKEGKIKWRGFSYHLTFDVDLKEDHERLTMILRELKKLKVKASFAVVGKWVEIYPKIYEEIIKGGHCLINHSYSHPFSEYFSKKRWNELEEMEKEEEIKRAHEKVLELGYEMKVFRTPHFGKQKDRGIYKILERLGYKASSSFLAIDSKFYPFKVGDVIELPLAICKKHPFTALDSFHSIRKGWHTKTDFIKVFNQTYEFYKKMEIPLVIYVDPIDINKEILRIIAKNSKGLDSLLH